MTRVDICASDDDETIGRFQSVLAELGGMPDDNWHDSPLGVGLMRYRFGSEELTVFRDAWLVDAAGPDELVQRILAALAGRPPGE
ncbi:MAG TPA: hypothetical protein VGJ05_10770 [Fimbriiglobus sp.]|jgi:hypothetical protein